MLRFFLIGRVAKRPKPVNERARRKGLRGIAKSGRAGPVPMADGGTGVKQASTTPSSMIRAERPMPTSYATERWPALPYAAWKDTRDTLHLWTQVVGKVRLALSPWLNHSWHVALYVTARGLTTSPIPWSGGSCQIDFDFIDHVLWVRTSSGQFRQIMLRPTS